MNNIFYSKVRLWHLLLPSLLLSMFTQTLTAQQANISKVEYYLEQDPGYGNATPVSIVPAANLINQNLNIDLTALAFGVNRLYIRAQDANGAWSHDNLSIIYKASLNVVKPPPAAIEYAEYYVDVDPGYGNGTAIAVNSGLDLANQSFNVDISTWQPGAYRLYARARDTAGTWSHDNLCIIYKPVGTGSSSPIAPISYIEYYIDSDPGYGNAVPVAIVPGLVLSQYAIPVNVTGLAAGNHQLVIRALDSNGVWGHDNIAEFSTNAPIVTPQINVVRKTTNEICAGSSFSLTHG